MASDMKYWDIFRDPKWLLDNFFRRYKVIIVSPSGAWLTSNVGSGSFIMKTHFVYVRTGTTANSRGMGYEYFIGWNSGDIDRSYIDWTKRLEIHLSIWRTGSDPQVVARLQVKESSAEGALAQRGIGIEVQNYTMYGEGYGTSRGTVPIGTLTDGRIAKVRIVKYGSQLEFWVNDVLQGVLTGDNVPNVKGGACYMVVSIVNGSTGGVDAFFGATTPMVIQEW
jgi:hypothetical protein